MSQWANPFLWTEDGQGYGGTSGTERFRIWVPYGYKPDQSVRGIVWKHALGVTIGANGGTIGPKEWQIARGLRAPLIECDLGGGATWNSDTFLTRVGEAWAQLKAKTNCKTDKMLSLGGSHGGGGAITYAVNNPANVAACATYIATIDPEYDRQNNVQGSQAGIEAVYGVGTPVPNAKQPKLLTWPSTVPGWHAYATDDPFTPGADYPPFVAQPGNQGRSLGAVGHDYNSVDVSEVVAFLYPYRA